MKNELNRNLQKVAPNLLNGLDHIWCGDGWYILLKNLFEIIENYINTSLPDDLKGQVKAIQVKEKFGGLRVYLSNSTPYIDGAISFAEKLSESTCELCGNFGSKSSLNHIIQTLCEPCYQVKSGSK